MPRSLLLIDDDHTLLTFLTRYFERQGWQVRAAADGRTGLELYDRAPADLVITDVGMPGMNGLQVIAVLRARDPDAAVLVVTAYDDVATAVEAVQLGADDFLTKPIDFQHLDATVRRAEETATLRRHARRAARSASGTAPRASEASHSPAMRTIEDQLALYAMHAEPVLVTGETGTGKGWIARRIHAASVRASGPFVEVHGAGLSAAQLDVELSGVGTRRTSQRGAPGRGLVEQARGGTLLLDEVGALAPDAQATLLGALERHRGGADVRLVATTTDDLETAVRAGTFRQDLYYRLAVLTLALPPLRARGPAEIARIAQWSLDDARRATRARPARLTDAALRALAAHTWPGNVRELRNAIGRASTLAPDAESIDVGHLPASVRGAPLAVDGAGGVGEDLSLRAAERAHLLRVLALCGNNKVHAARALGITRGTLYVRLQEYAAEDAAQRAVRAARPSKRVCSSAGLEANPVG